MDDFVYWDSIGGHVEDQARPPNRQNGVKNFSSDRSMKQSILCDDHLFIIEQSCFVFNCCKTPTLYCVFLAAQKEFSKITGGATCKARLSLWLFAGVLLVQVSPS